MVGPSSKIAARVAAQHMCGSTPKVARTYERVAMYDFDGTLFRSWEKPPTWWVGSELDTGRFSFFERPESIDFPCVPKSPSGEYWISRVVKSAQKDSSDRNTLVVLVTGRLKNHSSRIVDLLGQRGIKPDKTYFNPGMPAASFKTVILKNLLVGYNSIREVVIWENENQGVYEDALKRSVAAVGRDVDVTVHTVAVPAEPLQCGPEDFGLSEDTTASRVASRYCGNTSSG